MRNQMFVFTFILASACAQGQDKAPDFAKHAAPDSEVILFVADPLPHVQAIARSPQIAWFLNDTNLGQQSGLTPAAMNLSVIAASPYIPTEIAFTATDKSIAGLAELARMGLLWGLCSSTLEVDNKAGRDARSDFQKQVVTSLERLTLSDIDLWLNFRNRAAVNALFPQIVSIVEAYESDGIDIKSSRDEIAVDIRVKDTVPEEFWSEFLIELGLANRDDENLDMISEAMSELEFEIAIKRVKSGLHLRLGPPRENAAPLDLTKRRLWKFDSSTVLYTAWQTKQSGDVFRETRELWEQWKDKPIGKRLAQFDEDDLLSDLVTTGRYFEDALEGAMRVDVKDGELHVDMQQVAAKPAKPLVGSGILNLVPKGCESVTVDSTRSLAHHVSDYLDQFESRMSTRELQYEMTDRQRQGEILQTMTRFYYEDLKSVRRMLKQDSFDVFSEPVAVLLDSQGSGDLDIRMDFEGEPQRVQVTGIPMLEYAVVTGITDRAAAEKFLPGLFGNAMAPVVGEPIPVRTEKIDLGDGNIAVGLNDGWQANIPNGIRFNMGPQFRPHYIILKNGSQEFFVFSMSVPLTERIVAQLKSGKSDLSVADNQIALGVIKGRTVNRSLDMLLHAMFERDAVLTEGDAAGAFMEGMGIAGQQMGSLREMQALLTLFSEFRWETTQDGNVQTTKARSVIEEPAQ